MDENATLRALTGDENLLGISATIVDLPAPDTKRWVARRKAVVVNAVHSGAISLDEACRRYQLSIEEFAAWQRAIEAHGIAGLRVTRLQIYRDTPPARLAKPRYCIPARCRRPATSTANEDRWRQGRADRWRHCR